MSPLCQFAIILGAGRPIRGQIPTALTNIDDRRRVLDWQIEALPISRANVTFVGGYGLNEIAKYYPTLRFVLNPNWAENGPVASLMCALPPLGCRCLVTYADILYRSELVGSLCDITSDAAIVVDSQWRQRYENRTMDDISAAEVVQIREGFLVSAHGRVSSNRPVYPDAELTGLISLGPKAIQILHDLPPRASEWDIPLLLNEMLSRGLKIATIDCRGDWAELNAPQDVAHFVLGTKAQTLERLQNLVRLSEIGEQVTLTYGDWKAARDDCLQRISTAFVGDTLLVRSSAIGEDSFSSSQAGHFESVLGVDGKNLEFIVQAVERVLASYNDTNPLNQVLVQRMVDNVRLSGVVMTRTLSYGAPYRVINYDAHSGVTDSITSGYGTNLSTLYIHRDSFTPPNDVPHQLAPLLLAVCEIENLVGYDSLDIEFIVSKDDTVHIVQVRPIATDHMQWRGNDKQIREMLDYATNDFRRLQQPGPFILGSSAPFSLMTDWNPAEMIGSRPRQLARSIYEDLITRDVWARQRREYGYRCVAPQALMHNFAGHAYIDVRASLNSFVPAELDDALAEKLVEYGLERLRREPHLHDKIEFEIAFTCISFDFDDRVKSLHEAGFSSDEVQRLRSSLQKLTACGVARVETDLAAIDTLEIRQRQLQDAELAPLQAALLLINDCREYGTLPFAHLARAGFVAAALLKSAEAAGIISAMERATYLHSVSTIATEFRDNLVRLRTGKLTLHSFLEQYGYLRPGTYDITVSTYAETPQLYLSSSAITAQDNLSSVGWSENTCERFAVALLSLGIEADFVRVDRFMRLAIAGRERAKFAFTRGLSRALDLITQWGTDLGLTREELSNLSLNDLHSVDIGLVNENTLSRLCARAEENRLAHEIAQGIELPPIILNEGDLRSFLYPEMAPNFIGNSAITAPLICIDENSSDRQLAGKIVLVLRADPGHEWLFAQNIVGLVTAYGGANSHIAVRAAEFNLPAAIGVGEQTYRTLTAGGNLRLDCIQRTLSLLN